MTKLKGLSSVAYRTQSLIQQSNFLGADQFSLTAFDHERIIKSLLLLPPRYLR